MEERTTTLKTYWTSTSGIELLVAYSEEEKCPDEWLHISTMNQDMRTCMYNFYARVSVFKIFI